MFYHSNKLVAFAFLSSCLLQFLMVLFRLSGSLVLSSILGFIFYFGLTYLFISKKMILRQIEFGFAILIGILILQLPIRLYSFDSTSVTLVEFIFELLGIPYAFILTRFASKRFTIFLFISSFLLIVFGNIFLNKFWLHHVNYGNYTGDTFKEIGIKKIGFDYQGNEIFITDWKGKMVLLDFWHSKCSSCFTKFPQLEALNSKYGKSDSFLIFAVNHPLKSDTLNQSFRMIEQRNYTFNNIVLSDKSIIKSFDIQFFPTTVILNKDGNIIFLGDIEEAKIIIEKKMKTHNFK